MFYAVLLLLVPIASVHGRLCYSNSTFNFAHNDFHWTNFSAVIQAKQVATSSPCRVRVAVDYTGVKKPFVTVTFGSPVEHNRTHIGFGSTLQFIENNIRSIVSYVDYTCLSPDLCDKLFLEQWPRLLLNASNNSLHNSFLPLWKNSADSPSKCQAERVTNVCSSYVCFMLYEELKNLSYGRSQCNELTSTNPVSIHIRTDTGKRVNDYRCAKNVCTREIQYNSSVPTDDADELMMARRIREQTQTLIFQRATGIVAVLVIIGCVAYYIQCRKYRQGYRLTQTLA